MYSSVVQPKDQVSMVYQSGTVQRSSVHGIPVWYSPTIKCPLLVWYCPKIKCSWYTSLVHLRDQMSMVYQSGTAQRLSVHGIPVFYSPEIKCLYTSLVQPIDQVSMVFQSGTAQRSNVYGLPVWFSLEIKLVWQSPKPNYPRYASLVQSG